VLGLSIGKTRRGSLYFVARCATEVVVLGRQLDTTVGTFKNHGARWRRSGGGPGEGCARRPVGTYIYLHSVGASSHVAVPCLAR
jgi:hypothetical protein